MYTELWASQVAQRRKNLPAMQEMQEMWVQSLGGKGLHLAMTGEPRGFSPVTAGFSSYDGEFRLPLVLAQASPIVHSSCEGKLGIALE